MDESFGPEYVRPAQRDCPLCDCCTAALCERGRNSLRACGGHVDAGHRDTVGRCPCSAATTKQTALWRLAQVRITRMARELPLSPDALRLLRALAAGQAVEDPGGLVPSLKMRGLVDLGVRPLITELGRTYLAAVDDVRSVVVARIVDVDKKARTARVECAAWRTDEAVTVLLDQVLSESGLDVDSLPGRWMEAEANLLAPDADRLVLVGFRKASGPEVFGWKPVGGGDDE